MDGYIHGVPGHKDLTMTLTDTVSSIAHDAAQTATEFGKQAVVLGRSAAEAAADVANSAATGAQHLVHTVSQKVPTVTIKPKRSAPWGLIVGVAILGVVAAVFMKSKNKPSKSAGSDTVKGAADSGPVSIRKTA